jgi:fluoride exporter
LRSEAQGVNRRVGAGRVVYNKCTTRMIYLWIALGSALGGAARYWFYGFVARVLGETFPWGTLTVNVLGCSLIGLFATLTGPEGRWLAPSSFRMFVMTGICGGYTTFSTFGLETLNLARSGEWFKAAANVLASLLFCLAGVWIGHALATAINER